ncbi:hypothetical protein [Actinacidiphila glaucinigra]|uniref:hypothetical protein n=1 Tax=Actinacidiphila glaucinigra TaxID=235986 RepID=UPI003F55F9E3
MDIASNEDHPLRRLTLGQLRRRTSMKWRTHPEDVLPLWVAEMDVPLAAPCPGGRSAPMLMSWT